MLLNNMWNATRSLIILLSLCLVLALPGLATAQTATVVSVTAPGQVEAGEQFVVNVVVEPATDIAGVQFDLTFDPSLVTVDSVAEGNLLSQGGAATYFSPGSIDNVNGSIGGVAGAIITPGQTVSANGTFALITMTAGTEEGTCPLTLSGVIAGDINGQSVEVNIISSQVTIDTDASSPSGGGGGGSSSDKAPPRFANIGVASITMTTADICWTTQEKSSSQVEYWSSPHQFSPLDETLAVNHLVHLTDLLPATTYYYQVMSRDSAGNLAVSDEYQFTTSGKPADITVAALSITPGEVCIGEEVVVSVSVTNNGDATEKYKVVLKIDESVAETREIELDGGTTQEVTFLVVMTTAGIRSMDVNGLSGDIVVLANSDTAVNLISMEPRYHDDTDRLSFVSITYEVNNSTDQPVRGDIILKVKLDSQLVDNVVLVPESRLEPGITRGNLDYSPTEGWKPGTYTFYIELHEDGNFISGSIGDNLDITAEHATTTINWSILAIIILIVSVISTIAIFFIVCFRRRTI